MVVDFNQINTINAELDIYIPSLKLAVELNGIFHYEPIYGEEKLKQTQNNDNRKFQACLEKGIELCIIDTSGQKRFTELSSKPFLDIVVNLINFKLSNNKYEIVEREFYQSFIPVSYENIRLAPYNSIRLARHL